MPEASPGPGRHEARERAIGLLYESETRELTGGQLLDTLPLQPDPYAAAALVGVDDRREQIDRLIAEHALGWALDRLPNVDRAILRLAVWELLDQPGVPHAVVINEAIELAKSYSTERSPAYVNGVLDSIAAKLRS